MLSPLQLDRFFLQELHVEAEPCADGDFEAPNHEAYDVGISQEVAKTPEHQRYAVLLRVSMTGKQDEDVPLTSMKTLQIALRGFFSLPDDAPEEYVRQVVPGNCTAILYGIMRGIVSQVTANLPGGSQLLPTINIAAMLASADEVGDDSGSSEKLLEETP